MTTVSIAHVEECKLLSGGFAAFLQILLGIIALSVLIAKRYHEVPQRPLVVSIIIYLYINTSTSFLVFH